MLIPIRKSYQNNFMILDKKTFSIEIQFFILNLILFDKILSVTDRFILVIYNNFDFLL